MSHDAELLPLLPRLGPPDAAVAPTKEIFDASDLTAWITSDAYARLTLMVARLNAAVTSFTSDQECHLSEMTNKIVAMLDDLDTWVDEIPLHNDPQRFGNKAFRDWGARLEDRLESLHQRLIPPSHAKMLPELLEQFRGSFGSFVRIDYGSGHELAFIAYLTCLYLVGLLQERDERAIVTRIFSRYLQVCHRLQRVYNLEPAGSKGVWGLDDHQFLSYLFGSAQLIDHPRYSPKSILEPSLTPLDATDLYRFSVAQVRDLKRGPFHEHSPMLDNIARTVPNWRKVNAGLIKMWRDEVLGKQPVVQHFRFGGLLSWTRDGRALPPSRYAGLVEEKEVDGSLTKAPWALAGSTPIPATTVASMGITRAPWAR